MNPLKLKSHFKEAFIELLTEYFYYYAFKSRKEALEIARDRVNKEESFLSGIINKHFNSIVLTPLSIQLVVDNLLFECITKKKQMRIGKVIISLNFSDDPTIEFVNSNFIHGHLNKDGQISCLGGYKDFRTMCINEGLVNMIMSLYSFARYSRYGSSYNGEYIGAKNSYDMGPVAQGNMPAVVAAPKVSDFKVRSKW